MHTQPTEMHHQIPSLPGCVAGSRSPAEHGAGRVVWAVDHDGFRRCPIQAREQRLQVVDSELEGHPRVIEPRQPPRDCAARDTLRDRIERLIARPHAHNLVAGCQHGGHRQKDALLRRANDNLLDANRIVELANLGQQERVAARLRVAEGQPGPSGLVQMMVVTAVVAAVNLNKNVESHFFPSPARLHFVVGHLKKLGHGEGLRVRAAEQELCAELILREIPFECCHAVSGLRIACVLRAACCVLRAACCALRVARCALRVARHRTRVPNTGRGVPATSDMAVCSWQYDRLDFG